MDGLRGIARGVSFSYGRNDTARVGRLSAEAQAEEVKQIFVQQDAGEAKQSFVQQDAGEAKQGFAEQDARETKQGFAGQDAGEAKQDFAGQAVGEANQIFVQQKGQTVWQIAQEPDKEKQSENHMRHKAPRAVVKRYGAYNRWNVYFRAQSKNSRAQNANFRMQNETVGAQDASVKAQNSKTQAVEAEEQNVAQQIWQAQKEAEERRQRAKEQKEEGNRIINQLREQAESIKKAFDPKNRKNLYDATMDLTLIAQMEKIPGLKAMQSRLMFQMRSVKASGAETSEIRAAVNKLKKVVGKVKTKIKALEKEGVMEKKRKRAAEAKRKAKELALRRELEWRKKARKAREQKDIEESKMGMGANYGGPTGDPALDMAMDAFASMGSAAVTLDVGAVIDVAVADVGAAAADAGGGAVDISI